MTGKHAQLLDMRSQNLAICQNLHKCTNTNLDIQRCIFIGNQVE